MSRISPLEILIVSRLHSGALQGCSKRCFVPCCLLSPLLPHLLYQLGSVVFFWNNMLYIKLVLYHSSGKFNTYLYC